MNRKNHLLRVLGLAFGLAAVVGSVVGQGILRAPGVVAQASDSTVVLLALWVVGALLSMVLALPFAELGAALPSAGGPVDFAGRAFGPKARVATAWMLLLTLTSSNAMVTFVVGEFLVRLGVGRSSLSPGILGIGCLALFFLLNATGTRASGAIQIGFSTLKGIVLLALVVVLFAQPGAAAQPVAPSAPAVGWLPFATATVLVIGAYNGWGDVVVYGEEIENPGRAIPRALFGGILGVSALYILINAAVLHALPPPLAAQSNLAAADAAKGIFGERGDLVFTAFGVLSVGALANLSLMTTSRVAYASARAGILPHRLRFISRSGTPLAALAAVALASAAFLLSGSYLTLASTSTALAQGVYIVVTLTAIRMRIREPGLARPFRIPAFPLAIGAVLLVNLGLMAVFVYQDPFNALVGFALVAGLTLACALFARRAWHGELQPEIA